jgi:glucosamine--fructose-6-phosphate aminotransferase (isomerizing)
LLAKSPPTGKLGIGHTRWATHGRPSDENAHPHKVGPVSVVHNGIIENHMALRAELSAQGRTFTSETDTEIVAHLVDEALRKGAKDLPEAVRRSLERVQGAYAIVVMSDQHPDTLVAAKNASPLVLGLGDGENFVASDIPAILAHTRKMLFLEEGEIATVTRSGVSLMDLEGRPSCGPYREITWSAVQAEKGGFKHYMLKEIHEQPRAVTDTLRGRLDLKNATTILDDVSLDPAEIKKSSSPPAAPRSTRRWSASFSSSSWRASRSRSIWPASFATAIRSSARATCSSPCRSRARPPTTLAAAKEAKVRGARILAISNVLESSIPRMAHAAFYTHAGPEIGVASTKAFTTQLVSLLLIAIHLGRKTGALSEAPAASCSTRSCTCRTR